MHAHQSIARIVGIALSVAVSCVWGSSSTRAQSPSAAAASREALLEARLREIEKRNEEAERRQNAQYEALLREFRALQGQMRVPRMAGGAGGVTEGGGGQNGAGARENGARNAPSPAGRGSEGMIGRGTSSRSGPPEGGGADGTAGDRVGVAPYGAKGGGESTAGGKGKGKEEEENEPIRTTIGNGLRFDSEDDEFQLQFHNLTQAEMRNFPGAGDQSPLHTQFFIPRQRWYFTGRATRNVEFYTVINRGYGALDILDAFLNFNYDRRFQFRIGRTKTPTSYEYYQIAEGDLIAPERSLFIGNYSGNRQNGAMLHGQILDRRSEYAIGVFNGPRRSFQDFNNDKDLYLFGNIRPWQKTENLSALKYLNVGGAFNFGTENNPLQPNGLSTANDQTSSANVVRTLSPVFFQYNNNVIENGYRSQWSAWLAWYYKSFNLLAEYDGAIQDYAFENRPGRSRTRVPYEGFQVTAYYFLTGEQITRRVDVKPDRDFGFKNGKITGPGAVEVFGRFSSLNVGNEVFTAGLADRNLWSNQAYAIDTGLNWYLNRYTKIYLDYQYSGFGQPVYNGAHAYAQHFNLLWLRFQVFF
ncbi:MAG: hypothetical protein NVSMB9_24500 [Isosphaeraceae bacterium]